MITQIKILFGTEIRFLCRPTFQKELNKDKQLNDLDVLDELDDQDQLMNFQNEQVSGLWTMDYGLRTMYYGPRTKDK